MFGLGVKKCLFVLFALLLRRSKCQASTCQETGRANLDSAMVGFDPFEANAYEQFDPGFRNMIFEPTGKVFASKFNTYSLPNEFPSYFTCGLKFTSTVLTNFSHYESEKESRYLKTQDENDDNHSLNEINVMDVSSGGLEEDTEEKIIQDFFLETNGEIVQSKITCIVQELIVPPFSWPAFTADFSAALQALQLAENNSDPEYINKMYRKFVDMYGTHYMKKSKMGAEIIFQKLFTEIEVDDETKQARQNCVNGLVIKVIGNGATSVDSVISDFSKLSETCGGGQYFKNSGIESSRVIINGPPPRGTMEQWITAVEQSPVPIIFELGKLSSLFIRNGIKSSLSRSDVANACEAEATSNILLYNLLENLYSFYCEARGGKHCSAETASFDANNDCPPGHMGTPALLDIGDVSFELLQSVAKPFTIITTPQTSRVTALRQCALACVHHRSCGGFVWNTEQGPVCELVVDWREPGTVESRSRSVYRSLNYQGKWKLRDLPITESITWRSSTDACAALGMKLLPYPVTEQDRAVLSLRRRNYYYMDLQRNSAGAYIDSNNQAVPDPSTISRMFADKTHDGQHCLGLGYNRLKLYDFGCDAIDSDNSYGIICVE